MSGSSSRVSAATRATASLQRVAGLKPAALRALIERFGNAEAVFAAGPKAWAAAGLEPAMRRALAGSDRTGSAQDLKWLEVPNHHLIGWGDAAYPPLLATISSPPTALYVIGDPALLQRPQVAIVGSRNPTPDGRELAGEFAAFAAGAGYVVTSGLALGIDGAAHAGALDTQGATVAVMATGPEQIYPKRHRALAQRIAQQGALVTEFVPGTPALPEHFPRRNRIISGLAQATLVVEATPRSGSLITARYAAEQGREVCAIPGSVRSPLSRGCHALIRDGATLVEQPSDMLAALGAQPALMPVLATDPVPTAEAGPDPEYGALLDTLGFGPVTIDALAERSGLTAQTISSMLLILELKGEVTQLAGGRYARSRAAQTKR